MILAWVHVSLAGARSWVLPTLLIVEGMTLNHNGPTSLWGRLKSWVRGQELNL